MQNLNHAAGLRKVQRANFAGSGARIRTSYIGGASLVRGPVVLDLDNAGSITATRIPRRKTPCRGAIAAYKCRRSPEGGLWCACRSACERRIPCRRNRRRGRCWSRGRGHRCDRRRSRRRRVTGNRITATAAAAASGQCERESAQSNKETVTTSHPSPPKRKWPIKLSATCDFPRMLTQS